jgi:2-oxoglutarate ferredoxin oxidoreductase subunit alpha
MMEAVTLPEMRELSTLPNKSDWVITGRNMDGSMRMITSCLVPIDLVEKQNVLLAGIYKEWEETKSRAEVYRMDDAEIVLAAYGIGARIAKAVAEDLRLEGIRAGMIRPQTLYPFPAEKFEALNPARIKRVITLEMSIPGQLVEDVRAFTDRRIPVSHFGRSGGVLMKQEEACRAVKALIS